MRNSWILFGVFLLANCGSAPKSAAPAAPAAKVENRVKESDLTRVVLTPKAEERLGLQIATVVERTASSQMSVTGEIVPIPGRALVVSAPTSGVVSIVRSGLAAGQLVKAGEPLFQLTPMVAPQRDLKLTLEADLQSAKARFDNATQQLNRAKQLLRDLAGSQRNVDAAEQEHAQAKAAYEAAQQRLKRLETNPLDADVIMTVTAPAAGILRQIQVSQGQNVTAGAPLFEAVDFSSVWLRAPIYAGDLKEVASAATVDIRDVDGGGTVRKGRRVEAPPTADPLAITADIYYELVNTDLQLRPGQRLAVLLPLRSRNKTGLWAPLSSILYDVHGGTWVYIPEPNHAYRRQRVELIETSGQSALLARGVTAGTKVVAQGAAELFGTEFGVGH